MKSETSKRRIQEHAGRLTQDGSLSQGKGPTATSACDLGEVCHLGLCLLHAIIAKGWHSPNRLTHVPSAQSTKVEFKRVFDAPPGDQSGAGKQTPQPMMRSPFNSPKLNEALHCRPCKFAVHVQPRERLELSINGMAASRLVPTHILSGSYC